MTLINNIQQFVGYRNRQEAIYAIKKALPSISHDKIIHQYVPASSNILIKENNISMPEIIYQTIGEASIRNPTKSHIRSSSEHSLYNNNRVLAINAIDETSERIATIKNRPISSFLTTKSSSLVKKDHTHKNKVRTGICTII